MIRANKKSCSFAAQFFYCPIQNRQSANANPKGLISSLDKGAVRYIYLSYTIAFIVKEAKIV